VYEQAPDPDGYKWFFSVYVGETGGAPARITAFSIDDSDLSNNIAGWFGTLNLPAKGLLSADLKWSDLDVPSDHVFTVSGIDSAGEPWSQQVTARFLGEKSGAAMSLTSNPAVVTKIATSDRSCPTDHPFHQALILKELNGTAVTLNRFLAGGSDYTDRIAIWFGSTRLPALGTLQTGLCWAIQTTPVALSYEIDAVDDTGRYVQASLKADFISPDEQSAMVQFETGPVGSGSAAPALTTPPFLAGTDLIVSSLRSKPALGNRRK
jgi:hypothetical protein